MRVAVFGAAGRMGRAACDAIAADPDLVLVGAVAPRHAGDVIAGVAAVDAPEELASEVDVAVDLTRVEPARELLQWCASNGVHAVSGTTGFTDDDLAGFRASFTKSNCMIVPNFAIGAVLMMRFAELAAPWFETAEIVETHHDRKADAPSGTAMLTAARMAAASREWADDPTTTETVDGARGGSGPGGIRVHSLRMRGALAHQEVVLGSVGQMLTIRHDSLDRASFMPGVLLAVKHVADHPGVTIGLEAVLGL